ncbi:hypothetical protein FACS1894171_0460 [Clostridia bacterium]|nr:hypothetical protein FACS1894171_0460 [Clostridia bacterium]
MPDASSNFGYMLMSVKPGMVFISLKYTRQDIHFLRTFDIKMLVIACGTISTVALELLSGEYDMPIIGVARASSFRAAKATSNGKIGLIGTEASVKSGAYERYISEYNPGARVFSNPCPLFVSLVENGRTKRGDVVIETVTAEYLTPLKEAGVDVLVLGCTHYPLLSQVIGGFMGPEVRLIDSGAEAADYVSGVLMMTEKLAARDRPGTQKYFVSDSVESFVSLASIYLNRDVDGAVNFVDIGTY